MAVSHGVDEYTQYMGLTKRRPGVINGAAHLKEGDYEGKAVSIDYSSRPDFPVRRLRQGDAYSGAYTGRHAPAGGYATARSHASPRGANARPYPDAGSRPHSSPRPTSQGL